MHGLQLFFEAVWSLSSLQTLFNTAWAVLLGIVVGALPGLTATMGVALLTTLTYKMAPDQAILTLICMYVGAIYGGSRSAILLNIPGTPASAATTLDGYPLAKAGRAGEAMGIATTSSAIGTVIGTLFLAALAPALASVALDFHSYEYFWLALFGVIISGQLTTMHAPLKGYIAGILGLLVAMVGMEGIHAHVRFTLGMQRAERRHRPDPGDGRRLRLRRADERDVFQARRDGARHRRPRRPAFRRHLALQGHGAPLRRDRHLHRHHSRRRRGYRRLGLLRGGQALQQASGGVRQGLDRRPDRRGDRRQRRGARRPHSRARRSPSPARRRPPC